MTNSASARARPKRHHYIPEFYLKPWTVQGKVKQFSYEHDNLRIRSVAPKATAFVRNLYSLRDFPPDLAQQVEEKFFSPVDSQAADARDVFLDADADREWQGTMKLRSAWTRFLLSMLLRMPEDLTLFRAMWERELKDAYRDAEVDEGLWNTMLDRNSSKVERSLFQLLIRLIDNKNIGSKINAMRWRVIDVTDCRFPLITSDRPTAWTGLKQPQGHIALAISPTRVFVATNPQNTFPRYDRSMRSVIAERLNRGAVARAVRYVYGTRESEAALVRAHFGAEREKRLFEMMAEKRLIP